MYYDYICVIDFEATCEENNPPEYLHEIIEFPIALMNTRTLEIVSNCSSLLCYMYGEVQVRQKMLLAAASKAHKL